uniref:TPR_REGION domain-containing protein n=1 Tax=Syphacia muris TaxID=451379 RepID=A0A0N5AB45_9BILA
MVWALEKISTIEERKLLFGHIALILRYYDAAEANFLDSSQPVNALNVICDQMRRDLMQWKRALELAERLDPKQLSFIALEYAQQLAFIGNYTEALTHYENAQISVDDNDQQIKKILEHNRICQAGIAKTCILSGDIRRGLQVAMGLEDRDAIKDCATVLLKMKQYVEAGELYEAGQFYTYAASAYLQAKNWAQVSHLLPKVRSPKIHSQYAKIMESEKKYKQAALAYKNARDYTNLVRILLNNLNMANEAIKVVKESKSIEGAKQIASFFGKSGDQTSAIQFLVISHCYQEAFQLAVNTHQMEVYATAIQDSDSEDLFLQVAEYYLKIKDTKAAGKYFYKAGNYWRALDNLEFNGEDPESVELIINSAVETKDPELCRRVINFLVGDLDGIPKDPKYLFRYYVAMDMKDEAAATAVIIALDTKNRGSYRQAHQCLFQMHQDLLHKGIRVPYEMDNILMLLHSYTIVKSLIRRNEHMRAARMLSRVANNISKFPESEISILTAAAIQCAKVGLKKSAFNYATQIIRPDKRRKIDEKYKKKIETIVRQVKVDKSAIDEGDLKSDCPYCGKPTPETELVCGHCKNQIPYCIITGRHVTSSDLALCPSCHFPGFYSEFQRLLNNHENCPMCFGSIQNVTLENANEFFHKSKDANGQKIDTYFQNEL